MYNSDSFYQSIRRFYESRHYHSILIAILIPNTYKALLSLVNFYRWFFFGLYNFSSVYTIFLEPFDLFLYQIWQMNFTKRVFVIFKSFNLNLAVNFVVKYQLCNKINIAKPHKKQCLHIFYQSPNIIKTIKSQHLWWARHFYKSPNSRVIKIKTRQEQDNLDNQN